MSHHTSSSYYGDGSDKPVLSAYTVPIPVLECVKELVMVARASKTALEGILEAGEGNVSDDLLNASERFSGALRAIHYISLVYGVKCPVELD